MKVSERMKKHLVTVSDTATASEAAEKMKSENVGTVLVIHDGHLRGIVTDRQIATKVITEGKDPAKIRVSDFMTKNPVTGSPDMKICDVTQIMGDKGYRRIPIVENERPVGIISIADIVEHARTCNACTKNILNEVAKSEK